MVMPRYQRLGVQVSQVPQITTAGYQETARAGQASAEAMSRVTNFALRQMETYAQIEGAEYGALNAPSQQQIDDAIASGADLADLVPGDKWSVFGRAAQSQGLSSISTAMELQARKQIVDLQAAFETNQISLGDLETNLSSLVSAQTDVMRRIDPVTALKFSASLGVTANSAYLAAAKKQAVNDRADLEIQFRQGIDSLMRNAETIIAAGPTIGPDGAVITVDQKLNTIRDQIASAAMELNDPVFYQQKMNEFDAAMTNAKVGVVMDFATYAPAAALQSMTTDKPFPPEIEAVYQTMDGAEKRALFEQVQSALSRQYGLESQRHAHQERVYSERSDELQLQITQARLAGDTVLANELIDRQAAIDPIAAEQNLISLSEGAKNDDAATVSQLYAAAAYNTLLPEDIREAASQGLIKPETEKSLWNRYRAQSNERLSTAKTWLRNELGLPDQQPFSLTDEDRIANQHIDDIENAYIMAKERPENADLDPLQFFQERAADLTKKLEAQEKAKAKAKANTAWFDVQSKTKDYGMTPEQALQWFMENRTEFPASDRNSMQKSLEALVRGDFK